jgi:uncharacterized membrane protein
MFKILLALHLVFAVFAVGPLVGAATTAARGLRSGDAVATAGAARILTIYSYASVVVVILGMGLMSAKPPFGNADHVADFGDTWIWLSVLLWVVTMALTLGVVVPGLKANAQAAAARVAAAGGIVGLCYAAIVFLMVYRPGS